MPDIIGTLFSIGKELFSLRGDLSKARKERKEKVATYFALIAECIEDTSASLKQDIYPSGKCQELFDYSQQMETAVGDLVGPVKAKDLAARLEEVWEIERLFHELEGSSSVRSQKLAVLDQAAGHFRSTAAYVRVSR